MTQSEFDVRCEWGLHGVELLAAVSDLVVIVDVLSFSTCVDIATANGAAVLPYRFNDDSARDYAQARGALLAGPRGSASEYSLSPTGLLDIPAGVRLVLPSPNGSTLSLATGATPTLAGCRGSDRRRSHRSPPAREQVAGGQGCPGGLRERLFGPPRDGAGVRVRPAACRGRLSSGCGTLRQAELQRVRPLAAKRYL